MIVWRDFQYPDPHRCPKKCSGNGLCMMSKDEHPHGCVCLQHIGIADGIYAPVIKLTASGKRSPTVPSACPTHIF